MLRSIKSTGRRSYVTLNDASVGAGTLRLLIFNTDDERAKKVALVEHRKNIVEWDLPSELRDRGDRSGRIRSAVRGASYPDAAHARSLRAPMFEAIEVGSPAPPDQLHAGGRSRARQGRRTFATSHMPPPSRSRPLRRADICRSPPTPRSHARWYARSSESCASRPRARRSRRHRPYA